jgi:hypothetical protein
VPIEAVALNVFSALFVKAFWLFPDELTLLFSIFGYFAVYGWPAAKLAEPLPGAKSILHVSLQFSAATAPAWKTITREEFAEMIRADTRVRHRDALTSASTDLLAFLHRMRTAIRFLFVLGGIGPSLPRCVLDISGASALGS